MRNITTAGRIPSTQWFLGSTYSNGRSEKVSQDAVQMELQLRSIFFSFDKVEPNQSHKVSLRCETIAHWNEKLWSPIECIAGHSRCLLDDIGEVWSTTGHQAPGRATLQLLRWMPHHEDNYVVDGDKYPTRMPPRLPHRTGGTATTIALYATSNTQCIKYTLPIECGGYIRMAILSCTLWMVLYRTTTISNDFHGHC